MSVMTTTSTCVVVLPAGLAGQEVIDKLERKNLRYVWFDFHHECRKMKYQNLYKLVGTYQDNNTRPPPARPGP